MKTKIPFNIYFLILSSIVYLIYLIPTSFFAILFYISLEMLLVYAHFCRYACIAELDEFELKIKYLFPWDKSCVIKLKDIIEVDYAKGYYDLFAEKTIGSGLFSFPIYCYDRLLIKIVIDEKIETKLVNVNIRAFEFDKLFEKLNSKIKV